MKDLLVHVKIITYTLRLFSKYMKFCKKITSKKAITSCKNFFSLTDLAGCVLKYPNPYCWTYRNTHLR